VIAAFDGRHGAGQVQLCLSRNAELELLLGIRRAGRDGFVDRGGKRGSVAEDFIDALPDELGA